MTRVLPILRDAVKGLRRNLAMSVAVVLCSAVSLTLFGAGLLLNRQVDITSKHLFGRRLEILTLAVLGQLRPTNNWHRIAREWMYGDDPVTDLGRQEAEFYSRAAA